MDPVTAVGISNALMQAEMLADAVDGGLDRNALDEAVQAFGEAREQRFRPIYEFTAEMAKMSPDVPQEMMDLFMALPSSQRDIDAYFGVFAQTVPVAQFFAPDNVRRIIRQAAPQYATA